MFQSPTTPLPITQIWKTAFELTKVKFWKLLVLAVLGCIASFFPQQGLPLYLSAPTHIAPPATDMAPHLTFHVYLFFFFVSLISLFIWGTLLRQFGMQIVHQSETVRTSLWVTFKKLPILILAILFFSLVLVVGCLALIIPGIFLSLVGYFYYCFILVDNTPFFSGFKRAVQVVWGNWWRTFAIIFFPVLGIIITFLCAYLIFGFLFTMTEKSIQLHAILDGIVFFLMIVVGLLLGSFFYLYLQALTVTQWHDLKLRYALKHP